MNRRSFLVAVVGTVAASSVRLAHAGPPTSLGIGTRSLSQVVPRIVGCFHSR